jgi:hypothetical protein
MFKRATKEDKVAAFYGPLRATYNQSTELERMVNGGKNESFILESNESYKCALFDNIAEELFGRIVCRYIDRNDDSDTPRWTDEISNQFGE